jgi:hypothetical protein
VHYVGKIVPNFFAFVYIFLPMLFTATSHFQRLECEAESIPLSGECEGRVYLWRCSVDREVAEFYLLLCAVAMSFKEFH